MADRQATPTTLPAGAVFDDPNTASGPTGDPTTRSGLFDWDPDRNAWMLDHTVVDNYRYPTDIIINIRAGLSALFCLSLVACADDTNVAETRFEEFCRDFQFVPETEESNLARIRLLIDAGKIDPQTDLQFETISIEQVEIAGSSSIENLEIAKIKVTAPEANAALISLPQTKITRGGSISSSSPEYYDVDCFSVMGQTYFDFVEKGLEA